MISTSRQLFAVFSILLTYIPLASGHGYMKIPGARNSAWRLGFNNPVQYTDNQLNCGGFGVQWDQNGGKCGVCGDAWNAANTGEYVYPGKYAARQIITATYVQGQTIDVTIKITVTHKGTFVFRIGDIIQAPITQEKLVHTLPFADGSTIWTMTETNPFEETFHLKLPDELICDHCVLQWWWTAGNNWGDRQETFVNCADVRIVRSNSDAITTKPTQPTTPSTSTRATTTEPSSTRTTTEEPTSTARTTTAEPSSTRATTAEPSRTRTTTAEPSSTRTTTAEPSSTMTTSKRPTTTLAQSSTRATSTQIRSTLKSTKTRTPYVSRTKTTPTKSTKVPRTTKTTPKSDPKTASPTMATTGSRTKTRRSTPPTSARSTNKPVTTRNPNKITCWAVGLYAGRSYWDRMCKYSCLLRNRCPSHMCRCGAESTATTNRPTSTRNPANCKAIGEWANYRSGRKLCWYHCRYSKCPTDKCTEDCKF